MIPFLLSFLVRSALLGALGLAILALLRHRSAAVQHAVAVGTVAVMMALPLMASLIPTHRIEVAEVPDSLVYLTATTTTPSLSPPPDQEPVRSIDWNPILGYGWAGISLILFARIGVGLFGLSRRVGRSRAVALGRRVQVVEDPSGSVPLMVWLGRNTVLLPPSWSAWPNERLERVLAHEEAHVSRGDWFTQMFLLIASAAMWPNPVAHILSKRARALAEHAADDRVLAMGAEPSRYASDLLEIARGCQATPPAFAIQMAAKADVARRIEMILSNDTRRKKVGLFGLAAGATLLIGLSIPLSSWAIGPALQHKAAAPHAETYEIHARIYSLASADSFGSMHRFAVQKGAKCTDCHRDAKTGGVTPWSMEMAMSVSPAYAEETARRITDGGGVLLSSPTIKTGSGQLAEITIGPTEENKRTITVGLTPNPGTGGTTVITIHMMESVAGGGVLERLHGAVSCAPGRSIILTNKSKRRLIILDLKS